MAHVNCPKCSALATRGGFPAWEILVSIVFFPIGLLALLAGRKPTKCPECGWTFAA